MRHQAGQFSPLSMVLPRTDHLNCTAKKSAAASTSVSPEAQARKRTLLIDASPLIFRAFHSVPILGGAVPLNAVYGFLRTLLKLMRENPSDYIGTVWHGNYRK